MAGTSPRRSSRARTTHSQSNHTSTTSSTAGRPERTQKNAHDGDLLQKTTSQSPDDSPEDDIANAATEDTMRRRRTRAQDDESRGRRHTSVEKMETSADGDDMQEDDEAVRCICGYDDYPGPIPIEEDMRLTRDTSTTDATVVAEITDDSAGLFVQCDVCKVWQHGACVGIMTEETTPDEYFCEQCRKDLHKIYKAANGQRYSKYLPIANESRASSRSRSSIKEEVRSPTRKETRDRTTRQESILQATKRRSTMNSRDAALEEEQLRRAIEASKVDANPDSSESGSKRVKRGRSDSEDRRDRSKRQRTASRSASPSGVRPLATGQESSGDSQNNRNGIRKPRNGASRAAREPQEDFEKTEREERERARADAANKRKGRAERRRGDDDEILDEPIAAVRTSLNRQATGDKGGKISSSTRSEANGSAEIPPSSQNIPDTPPTRAGFQAVSKPKRSHQKKGKGRNQYTRDRDLGDDASPPRTASRDGADGTMLTGWKSGDLTKLHSRAKGGFNSKVSMYDMKRRATAMFDFIVRAQSEFAEVPVQSELEDENRATNTESTASGMQKRIADMDGDKASKKGDALGVVNDIDAPNLITNQVDTPADFKALSCADMMDKLVKDLVFWQQEYAT